MNVLYLTYDGLSSLLGQSQIWPYVSGLARDGHRFHLVTFEQPDRLERIGDAVARSVEQSGVAWHPHRFRSRPPVLAKMLDLRQMIASAQRIAAAERIDLTHARSYQAAEAALRVKRRHGVPFVFDMRGFWVDEKKEGGRWPEANPFFRLLYRHWKAKEAAFIANADHIVVLTEAARDAIRGSQSYRGQPVTVIPCCIDHAAFALRTAEARAAARSRLGIGAEETVLAYLGSIGTVYLIEDMLRFYHRVRQARGPCRFLFVGWHEPQAIAAKARAAGLDIPGAEIVVQPAEHGEVPFWLAAANLAIAFRKPTLSGLGASPTKLGEYLACGLPVIVNDGVGDVGKIVERLDAGAVLRSLSGEEMAETAARLDEILAIDPAALRERSRAVHDLDVALARYRAVYDGIAARGQSAHAAPGEPPTPLGVPRG